MTNPAENQFNFKLESSPFFAGLFQHSQCRELVEHACQKIREMTNAHVVAYIEHSDFKNGCKPLVVNPLSRAPAINQHYENAGQSRLCPFHFPEPFPSTVELAKSDPLAKSVYDALEARNILRIPIQIKGDSYGAILIIDLQENSLIEEVAAIMKPISSCLCLAMQKATALEELEHKKTDLQAEVEQKNLELVEKNRELQRAILELEQEKFRAEEANRTKSEFLAIMSHELRTPLNPIIGISDILLSKETDDQKIECLNLINNAGSQLLELITDILDFTQIEAGKLSIHPKKIGIRKFMDNVIATFEGKVLSLTTSLELDVDPDVAETVVLDPLRLRQIGINLISNAIKFTPEGKVQVELRQEGDILVLTVKDTGIGIPDEKLKTIWEPFKQVDSSISRKQSGSGLGLAIVYKLTKLMNGEVNLESEVGKGTTITVSLPVALNS